MPKEDVIFTDIFLSIVSKMTIKVYPRIGRVLDILKELNDLNNSITMKGQKYPTIILSLPFEEERGSVGYYSKVKVPRITIVTLSLATDDVYKRYATGGTYKTILYPLYYEFLKKCASSIYTVGGDPDMIKHKKMDNPGMQPIGKGSQDYVDIIEILGMELILSQIKKCK